MKQKTPEETIIYLRRRNKMYRDQIRDLEQRLTMRNAEAIAYGEEALYYHKKENALLEKSKMLQKKIYEYQELYYEAKKDLDIFRNYPKWVHILYRNKAWLRT